MPNVIAAPPNIGGMLCLMPQSLADATTGVPCSNIAKMQNPVEICWGAPNSPTVLSHYWAEVYHIMTTCGGGIG